MSSKNKRASKESAFMSVVAYLDIVSPRALDSLKSLNAALRDNFDNYEFVCVNDGHLKPDLRESLQVVVSHFGCPTTIVDMGKRQGLEAAMNAGIDMAVGDYVLEVDSIESLDPSFLLRSYSLLQGEGYDVISGVSARPSFKGAVFYPIFNKFSGATGRLETGSARLVSRRALNRVHSMSAFMPYRKAAYAASGLRMKSLPLEGAKAASKHSSAGLAIDGLALYTDFFYKTSAVISIAMVIVSLIEFVYVLAVFAHGGAIEGWVTSMFVITLGFLGLFIILTFLMKYVALLVKSQFNNLDYLVEGIEKIEGCC